MPEIKGDEELKEKVLEIILNFKPTEKISKEVADELVKLKSHIKNTLSSLPQEQQEIVELRYLKNLSVDDISQRLGKSKGEVTEILLNGIEAVRKNIGKNETKKIIPVHRESSVVSMPPEASGQKSFLAGFIGMIILIGIFFGTFFFVNKQLSGQLNTISEFIDETGDFLRKNIVNGNIISQVNEVKKNKKTTKPSNPNTITISGSTSLLTLANKWENDFSKKYSKYHLDLISSDSDSGINALIKGKVNIANSSRPVTSLDQRKAAENGLELAEYRVALDALVIVVNKKNPIQEISLDELKKIFNDDVNNWQELSGSGKTILPVVREKGSGTNDFAIGRILEGEYFPSTIVRRNSNVEIIKLVSENEGAISFVNSTNYPWGNENIKYLKVKTYENSLSVSPFEGQRLNEDVMRYGDYPLAHYLYLITLTEAPKQVQDFVDWVLSPRGQKVVQNSGLIPVVSEED